MKPLSTIEALETRIAPATILPGNQAVTYVDADGDFVTVKINVGTFITSDFTFNTTFGTAGPQQLRSINLAGDMTNDGTNLSIVATPFDFDGDTDLDGDGFANLGYLNASGIDLGVVAIDGDLGKIVAGNVNVGNPGVKMLTVNSLGRFDLNTGAPDLVGAITGALGALTVKTDIVNASLSVDDTDPMTFPHTGVLNIGAIKIGGGISGNAAAGSGSIFAQGNIASITLGGSLTGGSGDGSGVIKSKGLVGAVVIGGSIVGDGIGSGVLFAGDNFTSILVKGSVKGGSGDGSGRIDSDDVKTPMVTINGSLIGGSGEDSGVIDGSDRGFEILTIKGSIEGGTAEGSGLIRAGYLGTVLIEGNLVGGNATGSDSVGDTGVIKSFTTIKKLTIGGSIIAGRDDSTGTLTMSGAILVYDNLQSLTVKGGIQGTVGSNGTTRVAIVARGQETPSALHDVAIGSLTVLGSVSKTDVLAGYEPLTFSPAVADNPDAEISKVNITGDWVQSNLVAGAVSGGNGFGNSLDARITTGTTPDDPIRISRLGSVIIKGQALGTFGLSDHYGFVAEQIGAFKIGKRTVALSAATAVNDNFPLGITGDVRIREI